MVLVYASSVPLEWQNTAAAVRHPAKPVTIIIIIQRIDIASISARSSCWQSMLTHSQYANLRSIVYRQRKSR